MFRTSCHSQKMKMYLGWVKLDEEFSWWIYSDGSWMLNAFGC